MGRMKRLLILLPLMLLLAACGNNPSSDLERAASPAGRLIVDTAQNQIISLNMETMEQTVLFNRPQLSWVYEIDASAEANQIAIAYTRPPEPGKAPKYDRSGIFLLPLDTLSDTPQQLLGGDTENEWFVNPMWSADGKTLFFVRQSIDEQADGAFVTNVWLESVEIASGERRLLAQDAVWPRLSNDGEKIAWINYDDEADQFGLSIANVDGSNQKILLDIGEVTSISTPMFSPDDKWIYFTAAADQEATRTWLDIALGVKIAKAHAKHNVPSHWWRIPANGGTPKQVTASTHDIVYGDFSPVSTHLAYTTANGGLYLANDDGSNEQVISEAAVYRTFAWLP